MKIPFVNTNDPDSIRRAFQKLTAELGPASVPTFAGLTLTGLDASEFVFTDADKKLSSVDVPLVVGYGGTGAATLTDHSILLGSETDAVTALGAATNGQLPIGSTGADPVLAGLTGTANQINIANAAGSITLSTPQDIHTDATPEFEGMTISEDDLANIDFTDANGTFSSYNDGSGHLKGETTETGGLILSGTAIALRHTADGANVVLISSNDATFAGEITANTAFNVGATEITTLGTDCEVTAIAGALLGLQSDDTDEYAERDLKLSAGYPFSLSFWFKITDASNYCPLFTMVDSSLTNVVYGLEVNAETLYLVARNTTVKTTTFGISDNTWYHVVVLFESNTSKKLYVDNDLKGTITDSVAWNSGVDRFSLFRYGDASPAYNTGTCIIDEVAFWNVTLAADDIADLYNSGDGYFIDPGTDFPTSGTPISTGFVGLWHLDEGSGSDILDASGNGNHLTAYDAVSWPTGKVQAPGTAGSADIDIWTASDGVDSGESGTLTFGDNQTETIIDGQSIKFNLSGNEAGRIKEGGYVSFDGNLGLGTESPAYKLHIYQEGYKSASVFETFFNTGNSSDLISEWYDNSVLRSSLASTGVQTWNLYNGAERGSIAYGTPNNEPGIVLTDSAGNNRCQLKIRTNTGMSFGSTSSSGNPGEMMTLYHAGYLQLFNTGPGLQFWNTTQEDSDGGRESWIIFSGEQSGGENTTLARIDVSHDGAADDQKGKIEISTNDGSDDDTPTTRVTIDSAGATDVIGDFTAGTIQADNGFTGTGAYTNFTIVGGIITAAS